MGLSLAKCCVQTTLMDVLAGRKTGGLTTGDIRVDGHPKDQATFARVAGYCEQVLRPLLRGLGWQISRLQRQIMPLLCKSRIRDPSSC